MSEKHKRPKVGILLVRKNNGDYEAILQTRGTYDFRKDAPQTWAGINQVTVEGKKHAHEEDLHALRRELHEELNQTAGEFVFKLLIGDGFDKHSILLKEDHLTIFVLEIPNDFLKDYGIRPENITGGFRPVTRHHMSNMVVANPEWRRAIHPYDLNTIVVMPHVKKALETLFTKMCPGPKK